MTVNDDPGPDTNSNEPLCLPKKVAIAYTDVRREYYDSDEVYESDRDADVYAGEIAKYVTKMGIDVALFPGDENLPGNLKKYAPDMALNLVDSVRGQITLGSSIPGVFEILHIPYTGAGALGFSLGCNKFLMYQLMQAEGIPVPVHQLLTAPGDMIDPALRYPLFPKLNLEHSSVGIDENNVCENERQLRAKVRDLMAKFHQPVLVDEFIAGIEVTASVLDGINTKVYAVQRSTGGDTKNDIVTFDKKWQSWLGMSYTKYEDPKLRTLTKQAFDVLKMSDYGRIDIRVDAAGRYYFIDPNANPFFGPAKETHATYSIILDMYGVDFPEVLKRIFLNTAADAARDGGGWH